MRAASGEAFDIARAVQLALVAVVTIAFIWVAAPFSGAILWAVVATMLFDPLNQRLLRHMPAHPGSAASVTLLAIVALAIVPAVLLAIALVHELASVYGRFTGGDIDLVRLFVDAQTRLPDWARSGLREMGFGDIVTVNAKLNQGLASSLRTIATHTVNVGQSALSFFVALAAMLYLTFFLLRDGRDLVRRIEQALPLPAAQRDALFKRFAAIARATIRGSLVVAILQGSIGGIAFRVLGIPDALLWGLAMGVFSLFPALGTGLIWVPVTLFLLLTGAIWQGVALGLCGFFVIGTVDNIVRPILVGHDARMPDYVVLISTLGGFELMGFNGFIAGPIIAGLFMAVWGSSARPAERDLA